MCAGGRACERRFPALALGNSSGDAEEGALLFSDELVDWCDISPCA
jgi:hypothetical protein